MTKVLLIIFLSQMSFSQVTSNNHFVGNDKTSKNLLKKISNNTSKFDIYILWGYNRSFHAPSTTQIETKNGTIQIVDAKAYDRPTELGLNYINPTKFTTPQYNFKIGFSKQTKSGERGVELGIDHMKWVFDEKRAYDINGDYREDLHAITENGYEQLSFQELIEAENATPFQFEYSDGHNYVYVSQFFLFDILQLLQEKIKFSIGVEGGAGLYIPKPHLKKLLKTENSFDYEGKNGHFQLSGHGFHAGLKTKIMFFNRLFIESSMRGININNHSNITSPEEITINQKSMKSVEFYTGIGLILKRKKTKQEPQKGPLSY